MSRRVRVSLLAVVVCTTLCVAVPAPLAVAEPGVSPGAVEVTLRPGGRTMVPTTMTAPTVVPDPDIVFLADTTGSMDPALANVRNALPSIMATITAAAPTARFGVAEYKEQRDGARVFTVNSGLTAERPRITTAAQQWLYGVGGGGNPQTDFLNAHHQLASGAVKWRPTGSRVIAWFGDARSNDPSVGRTLAATTTALAGARAKVVAVPITGTAAPGLDERGQATAITKATGGVLMPGRPMNQVADAILAGIRSLPVTVAPRATCDQPITVTTFPWTAPTVRSGTTTPFRVTVGARPDAVPGNYRCTLDFQVDGQSVGHTQTVLVHVPSDRPTVRIDDVSVEEGNYYTTATLTVSLDTHGTQPVTVDWATADGTANYYDYSSDSGTLTFQPGEDRKQVTIYVAGDSEDEPDETFFVELSDATNAVLGDDSGTVTILDDDEPLSPVRINDVATPEGDEGTSTATLTVSLDFASASPVTVYWATVPGTANQNDFQAGSGTLTFQPGVTSLPLPISIVGDWSDEPNETFTVHLSSVINGVIADADGVVTILDNDATIG